MFRRSEQRRWVREARNSGSDTLDTAIDDVAADLAASVAMVQEIAEKEGIDLHAPMPAQPVVLASRRLRNAGIALLDALQEGLRDSQAPPGLTASAPDDAVAVSIALTTKLGRITSYLTHGRDDVWLFDAVPNLLLLERLRRELDGTLVELDGRLLDDGAHATIQRALAEIDAVVCPLIKDVGAAERALLDQLIERGEAPSPFCIAEGAGGSS